MLKQFLESVPAENIYVGKSLRKERHVNVSYITNKRFGSQWVIHCSFKNFKRVFKEVYGFEFNVRWDKLAHYGSKNFKNEIG